MKKNNYPFLITSRSCPAAYSKSLGGKNWSLIWLLEKRYKEKKRLKRSHRGNRKYQKKGFLARPGISNTYYRRFFPFRGGQALNLAKAATTYKNQKGFAEFCSKFVLFTKSGPGKAPGMVLKSLFFEREADEKSIFRILSER